MLVYKYMHGFLFAFSHAQYTLLPPNLPSYATHWKYLHLSLSIDCDYADKALPEIVRVRGPGTSGGGGQKKKRKQRKSKSDDRSKNDDEEENEVILEELLKQ